MGKLGLALRVFIRVIRDRKFAEAVAPLLVGGAPRVEVQQVEPRPPVTSVKPQPAAPVQVQRSDALNLLAVLQREARFVDFVKEDLASFSDDQIGAAARDVHRGCATALERIVGLRPLEPLEDGAAMTVPANFDASRFRLTGNYAGAGPHQGTLFHHGWVATKLELPEWRGSSAAERIVAPVEVEVR